MTWTNPPPTTVQLRSQLVLCPSLIALGYVESSFHYPDAALTGDTPDTFPLGVITDTQNKRTRYAEGAIPLPSGTFIVVLYVDDSQLSNAGALESLGRAVLKELGEQYYGLAISDSECSVASSPTPGGRVASAHYRTITLTIQYGLG